MKTGRITALAAALAMAAVAQTSKENQVRDRGRTPVADETQTLDRGRLGRQDAVPPTALTFRGMLVDAGCRDRTQTNLVRPAIPTGRDLPAQTPQEESSQNSERAKLGFATGKTQPQSGSVSAAGITVDAKTIQSEREDVLSHQVPDLLTRQPDPTCAVTGGTRAFALLMNNGRLLGLDEGGNTFALQSVQSTDAGRALLNGKSSGFKPKASIKGRVRGDKLIVDNLNLS
jgi:hypothetical protein